MMTLDSKVQKSADWLTTDMDGETVMMSMENGAYYALTETGTSVWEKIDEPVKVSDLCLQLQDEYQVTAEQCEAETLSLLNSLEEEKMIIVVD